MQVTAKKDKIFKPVTLSIIIETEEEFAALKALTAKDFSVPHSLRERNDITTEQQIALRNAFVSIHNELRVLG